MDKNSRTEFFKVELKDSTGDKLNEFLKEFIDKGYKVVSIKKNRYCDPSIQIGSYQLYTHDMYEIKLEK
jgi:hypothetical protein